MLAYIIIEKRELLNAKPESFTRYKVDFNTFIAIYFEKICHVLDYRKSLPVYRSIRLEKMLKLKNLQNYNLQHVDFISAKIRN